MLTGIGRRPPEFLPTEENKTEKKSFTEQSSIDMFSLGKAFSTLLQTGRGISEGGKVLGGILARLDERKSKEPFLDVLEIASGFANSGYEEAVKEYIYLSGTPRFLNCQEELKTLEALISKITTLPPARAELNLLVGSRGMGKTLFIEEAASILRTEGITVVKFEPSLANDGTLEDEVSLAVGMVEEVREGEDLYSPSEHAEALLKCFSDRTVFIMIDNVDALGKKDLALLRSLLSSKTDARCAIFGSIRPEELNEFSLRAEVKSVIELREFTEQNFQEMLIDYVSPATASTDLGHATYSTFGGNPSILSSAIQSMIRALPLALIDNPAAIAEMTDGLEDFLGMAFEELFFERYLALSQHRRLLIDLLSCFKMPPTFEILRDLVPYGEGKLIQILTSLEQEGFILSTKDNHRYYIRHIRIKHRIYEDLKGERAKLHSFISSRMDPHFDSDNWPFIAELARQNELGENSPKARELYIIAGDGASHLEKVREAAESFRRAYALSNGEPPELRFSILQKLAQVHDANDAYRESVETYEQMLALIPEGDLRRIVVHKPLGKAYLRLGENANAMKNFSEILKYTLTENDQFEIQQEIISLKIDEGRYDEAIRMSDGQRHLAARNPDKTLLALVETDLGIARFLKGEYSESLVCFTTAFEIYQDMKNRRKMIDELTNIGNVFNAMREHRKALEKWEDALGMITEVGTQQQRAQALNNIGIAHYNLGEHKGARSYYESAKKIFTQLNSKTGIVTTLANLGEVDFALGEYEL
ncbi:MAG TPA: tetratricopeptide repeat protein, partial [Bacteroidota bacterium]|nr:tetratricopeptide repeat protein [Bacteroidota bacterium]